MQETMQKLLDAKKANEKHTKARRPGYHSPWAASQRCGMPWPRFERGMNNGEVDYKEFGGKRFVTDQEIARIRGLHGLSPTPERPDEPPVEAKPLKGASQKPQQVEANSLKSSFPKGKSPLEAVPSG